MTELFDILSNALQAFGQTLLIAPSDYTQIRDWSLSLYLGQRLEGGWRSRPG
jgi:hypothetical protein